MKVVAVLLLGIVAASALSEMEYQRMFTSWVAENDKSYSHEEFFHRYNTFKDNVDWINANNAANKSYTVGINKFSDLNTAEFGAQMCGFKAPSQPAIPIVRPWERVAITPVDWLAAGAVTPVKDQGQCGSCWAFSSTGAIEGAWFIAKNELVSVAEQQLVDCSTSFGNQGCNGGLMTNSFRYVISNKGIGSEASYKYTARDGTCKSVPSVVTISAFKELPAGEAAVVAAVQVGPVAIAIEADANCFQHYKSGVLDDRSCGTSLNHGVLAVGLGHDATSGKDYWQVKNSWGASWGDKGYIKLVYGKNQCGLAVKWNAYPTV
jgi:cathepsin L